MILAIAMPKAERYIRTIRNANKREYARAYLNFIAEHPATWRDRNGPDYQCSYMAAQAVRMHIAELIEARS